MDHKLWVLKNIKFKVLNMVSGKSPTLLDYDTPYDICNNHRELREVFDPAMESAVLG